MALGIVPFSSNVAALARQHRLPDFFIVGAAKAGTTSLYEHLRSAPGVHMSPVKEPHYFAPNVWTDQPDKKVVDPAAYRALFQWADEKDAVGEASPFYLWDPDSPALIKEMVPQARVIMMLRDPVERAFSHYLMEVGSGSETLSFYEALQANARQSDGTWGVGRHYLEMGQYSKQVRRYLDRFGDSKIKVIFFEDFKEDAKAIVEEILRFLGVEGRDIILEAKVHNAFAAPRGRWARHFILSGPARRLARTLVPRPLRQLVLRRLLLKPGGKPEMSLEARDFLRSFYQEDLSVLQDMLVDQELPWQWTGG